MRISNRSPIISCVGIDGIERTSERKAEPPSEVSAILAINDEAALECVMLFWKWTESIYFWYLNLGKNIEAALENIILFLKIPGVSLRYLKLAINDYNT